MGVPDGTYTVIPLRIISLIGLLAAFAGLAYGVKVVFEVLFFGIAVPGYPSIMVAVVLLGVMLFAMWASRLGPRALTRLDLCATHPTRV